MPVKVPVSVPETVNPTKVEAVEEVAVIVPKVALPIVVDDISPCGNAKSEVVL